MLDARRVDLVCGRYKCNETCNTIHEHVPLMLVIRKQLLLWFTIPMVNAAFDCLVILNTLLLVMVRVNIYFLYFFDFIFSVADSFLIFFSFFLLSFASFLFFYRKYHWKIPGV